MTTIINQARRGFGGGSGQKIFSRNIDLHHPIKHKRKPPPFKDEGLILLSIIIFYKSSSLLIKKRNSS